MNSIDLKNRTAIVTGGARGVGFAIAKRLQRSVPTAAGGARTNGSLFVYCLEMLVH